MSQKEPRSSQSLPRLYIPQPLKPFTVSMKWRVSSKKGVELLSNSLQEDKDKEQVTVYFDGEKQMIPAQKIPLNEQNIYESYMMEEALNQEEAIRGRGDLEEKMNLEENLFTQQNLTEEAERVKKQEGYHHQEIDGIHLLRGPLHFGQFIKEENEEWLPEATEDMESNAKKENSQKMMMEAAAIETVSDMERMIIGEEEFALESGVYTSPVEIAEEDLALKVVETGAVSDMERIVIKEEEPSPASETNATSIETMQEESGAI
jgi:hypothetical protein